MEAAIATMVRMGAAVAQAAQAAACSGRAAHEIEVNWATEQKTRGHNPSNSSTEALGNRPVPHLPSLLLLAFQPSTEHATKSRDMPLHLGELMVLKLFKILLEPPCKLA